MANNEKSRKPFGGTNKIRLAAVLAVGVLAGGGAMLAAGIGERSVTDSPNPDAAAGTSSGPPESQGELVQFSDKKAQFQVSYPRGWTRLQPRDPNVVLLVGKGSASFQVRVVPLKADVGEAQLDTVKPLTDGIVASNKTAKLLADPERIQVGSLPGFFYFYTFRDPASGQQGAHSHFFLFNKRNMITLVFQSVPAGEFRGIAKTFDQITSSFRTLRN